MKLQKLYNSVVKFGAAADPRKNKAGIKSYPDTRILYGKPGLEINKILVGIDIEVGELLLADIIRRREGLDLVIAHHPEGKAYAGLHEVMRLQLDLLRQAGVAKNTAIKLLEERILEVERRVLPQNHTRAVDAARLLDIPFLCMHTPADNHVYRFLEALFNREKPRLVEDVIRLLKGIPEYRIAEEFKTGPRVILGSPKRQAGKIMLEMTGGTEGPKDVFGRLYKAGVKTLVSMHLSEEHFKKAKDANLNAIIAGHISSDTLGLNLLLDNLEREAGRPFQVTSCSGFTRIKRK